MNLLEFNTGAGAPQTKPWLNPVVNDLEASTVTVAGRVLQEHKNGTHPTPYSIWSSIDATTITGTTALTNAMGTTSGTILIPATSIYPGMTARVKVGGQLVATGAGQTCTISLRNPAGTYTYASTVLTSVGAATTQVDATLVSQVKVLGGPGVGAASGVGSAVFSGANFADTVNVGVDGVTFDSTAGIAYTLFVQNSAAGVSFDRQTSVAVLDF